MSKHQYTPGPWFWEKGTSFIGTNKEDSQTIAYVSDHRNNKRRSNSEIVANTRLIAAAPELLEALIAIVNKLENPADGLDRYPNPAFGETIAAKALIKKVLR